MTGKQQLKKLVEAEIEILALQVYIEEFLWP
jgi:hypothetical protein